MKRNVLFGMLLVVLLWGAWYWEHRSVEVPGVLGSFSWKELSAIEISGVILKKVENRWLAIESGREVDAEKVRELWDALGMLRTERELTGGNILRSEKFPSSSDRLVIRLPRGRLEILLGSKLRFNQSFYLETVEVRDDKESTRQWVARDHSSEPGIYNVETVHRSSAKYQRLKSLFQLKEEDFYSKERT